MSTRITWLLKYKKVLYEYLKGPVHVAQWSTHLSAMCSEAWCISGARLKAQSRHIHLPLKNYFN